MGVLYVLDEPSIGLHQRDNARLLATLMAMRDLGNSVLVVEHDEETIRAADWVIDLGPGAGRARRRGGGRGARRTRSRRLPESLTGEVPDAASSRCRCPRRGARGAGEASSCAARGRTTCKNLDVRVPARRDDRGHGRLGLGQEHAGQRHPLQGAGARASRRVATSRASTTRSRGSFEIDKVITIDQAPIGRTPRSNPATYTNVFNPIRELMARTPEARARGYGRGGSASTSRAAAARRARGTGRSRSRCTSCPTSTSRARSAAASATTARRCRCTTRGKSIAEILELHGGAGARAVRATSRRSR